MINPVTYELIKTALATDCALADRLIYKVLFNPGGVWDAAHLKRTKAQLAQSPDRRLRQIAAFFNLTFIERRTVLPQRVFAVNLAHAQARSG